MGNRSRLLISIFFIVWIPMELRAQSLKFASVNFWSGLDYVGSWSMGEYESAETREMRFQILMKELRKLGPDVIALQESNPIRTVARRLAQELNYDYIYQRVNAGIKIGWLGVPTNLNEGIALLARKDLKLEYVDVLDLSKRFGAFGNVISLHFEDQNAALVGRIFFNGVEVYVVNVHLSAAVPMNDAAREKLKPLAGDQNDVALKEMEEEAILREKEVQRLLEYLDGNIDGKPVVLLGDFNASRESPEIRSILSHGYVDAMAVGGKGTAPTWDAERNSNIAFSRRTVSARNEPLGIAGHLSAWYDQFSRGIDYVFFNKSFSREDVKHAEVFLDQPNDGVFASDHYGVLAEIDFSRLIASQPVERSFSKIIAGRTLEPLPILTYDTDVGFGYGAKAFFLNYAGLAEC
jgi:endonuclease/exonuclease/phosphatase family metal-dependent hydrolase